MNAFQRTLALAIVAGLVAIFAGPDKVRAVDYGAMHLYANLHGHEMVGWAEYTAAHRYRVLVAQVQPVADSKLKPAPMAAATFLVQRGTRIQKLGVASADKLGVCTLRLDTRRFQRVPQLQKGDRIMVCDAASGHGMCGGPLLLMPTSRY
jgi:hypothetical protein